MSETKKHIRMPLCFTEFHCIGGGCEDNCCIGWDVEIDRKTHQKYQQVKDKELSQLIQNSIYENPDSYNQNVDYAIVELANNNRCPFLNKDHLCKIQAKLGHDYLSNVCAAYPRYANEINGVVEYSVNVSCPEAARLVLTNRQGLEFTSREALLSSKMIINFMIDTDEHRGNNLLKHFLELRSFTISLLQNRTYPLWERILILGHFYKELQETAYGKHKLPVQRVIEMFSQKIKKADWRPEASLSSAKDQSQYRTMKEITDKLVTMTGIDSQRYLRFMEEFSQGLHISANSDPEEEETLYRKVCSQYYEPFMKNHEYLIENYLVNYVFGSLFPASESTKPFEAFLMLAIRYALIKYYLIGISSFRKGLTEEDCIRFIQVFSKAIEHHHTYLEDIASYMKRRKYDTLPTIELLLKN